MSRKIMLPEVKVLLFGIIAATGLAIATSSVASSDLDISKTTGRFKYNYDTIISVGAHYESWKCSSSGVFITMSDKRDYTRVYCLSESEVDSIIISLLEAKHWTIKIQQLND